MLAAGLGHVGPAAAAAADQLGRAADPGDRVQPALDQVAAQARPPASPCPRPARLPSRTATGAALRRNWSISCRKTCGAAGDLGDHHGRLAELRRRRPGAARRRPPRTSPPAARLLLQPAATPWPWPRRDRALPRARPASAAAVRGQGGLRAANVVQGRPAGQGRDPPRAGRHALLADDLQQADLGRRCPGACRRKVPC